MSIKDLVTDIKHNGLLASMHQLEELYKLAIENEEKLADSQREFRAADATIENLQMQVDKLAAENAGLKENRKNLAEFIHEELDAGYPLNMRIETPATDALLAEVRAQGVEMFAQWCRGERDFTLIDEDVADAAAYEECVKRAEYFAAQIRKGVQS